MDGEGSDTESGDPALYGALMEVMYDLHHAHVSEVSADDALRLLGRALDQARACIQADAGTLFISDESTRDLIFAVVQGPVPPEQLQWQKVPKGAGVVHWVAKNRQPATVNRVSEDDRFFQTFDNITDFETVSILAIPLLDGDQVLGVLELLNKRDGQRFTNGDLHTLVVLGHFVGNLLSHLGDNADTIG